MKEILVNINFRIISFEKKIKIKLLTTNAVYYIWFLKYLKNINKRQFYSGPLFLKHYKLSMFFWMYILILTDYLINEDQTIRFRISWSQVFFQFI